MKIKIKIPRRDLIKETDFKKKVESHYLQWKEGLLEKAKNVKDLKELRKIFDELDKNQFDWDSTTGQWLEISEPYDIICITIKLPGLKKDHKRYVIYGILSFSKGLTDSFDHMGDLERLLYIQDNNGNYFAYSTIGHGYLELFPEILGKKETFNELVRNEEYVFELGDHSLCTQRDNTKILIGKISFIDIFRIIKSNIYKDYVYKSIPIISEVDMEKKLEINWFDYVNVVIAIDQYIRDELKKFSLIFRVKRAFTKFWNYIRKKNRKIDYIYLLYAIKSSLWHIPIFKQEKIVRRIKDIAGKILLEENRDTKIFDMLDELLKKLDNLIDPIEFLKWKCRQDPEKLKEKFDLDFTKEIPLAALEALPVAFSMLLNKTLEDIGYPEKSPPREKGKRIIFWLSGNIYRILRSQFSNISKKLSSRFKTVTTIVDSVAFGYEEEEEDEEEKEDIE